MKGLFDLKGMNLWLVGSAIGLNIILAGVLLIVVLFLLAGVDKAPVWLQMGMILWGFLGPLFAGWLVGKMAGDNRGPSYGVIGSLGSLMLYLVMLLPTGVFGLMMATVSVLGGLNGGILSRRRGES